jgi:Domain of unknown function (DUF5122) beta-propeller
MPDGSIDTSFPDLMPEHSSNYSVTTIAVQDDGKILVGANVDRVNPGGTGSLGVSLLFRLHPNGLVDGSFQNGIPFIWNIEVNASVTYVPSSLTLQANGKILVGRKDKVWRLDPDGSVDSSFALDMGVPGFGPPGEGVKSIALQADGDMILAGDFYAVENRTYSHLAKVNALGRLNLNFDLNPNHRLQGTMLQSDGRALLSGQFTTFNPSPNGPLAQRKFFARANNGAGSQNLVVLNANSAVWQRNGSAPEVTQVVVERSTNGGATWQRAGQAVRLPGTSYWELGGLRLSGSGTLRIYGWATGGEGNGSGQLMATYANYNLPVLPASPLPVITTLPPAVTSTSTCDIRGQVQPGPNWSVVPFFQIATTTRAALDLATSLPFLPVVSSDQTITGRASNLLPGEDYVVRAVGIADQLTLYGQWLPFSTTDRAVWMQAQFAASLGNPAISDWRADPDGDSIPNLLEWMGTTPPLVRTALPTLIPEFRGFPISSFYYPVSDLPKSDEWVAVDSSTDLRTWTRRDLQDYRPGDPGLLPGFNQPAVDRLFARVQCGIRSTVAIPRLFNTGVQDNGLTLPDTSYDPHWTVSGHGASGAPTVITSARGVFPVQPGPWMGDSPNAAWITPSLFDINVAAGDYIYTTSFILPWGVDPRQASIRGRTASDNTLVSIRLNNTLTPMNTSGFAAMGNEWILTTGFRTGLNTLEFTVNNADFGANPSGLRVELAGTWQQSGLQPIPGLLSSGFRVLDTASLAHGAPDLNIQSPVPYGTPPIVRRTSLPGGWLDQARSSAWVIPEAAPLNQPPGYYYYDVLFDLTGLDRNTVEIAATYLADDSAEVFLNNTKIANPQFGYSAWSSFGIDRTNRQPLLPGINVLRFIVTNAGVTDNPTGLRYEFLHAVALPSVPGN